MANHKSVLIRFNIDTDDAELYQHLLSLETSKTQYIKNLIRKDITTNNIQKEIKEAVKVSLDEYFNKNQGKLPLVGTSSNMEEVQEEKINEDVITTDTEEAVDNKEESKTSNSMDFLRSMGL